MNHAICPAFCILCLLAGHLDAEAARVESGCMGNALESCYVIIDGPIEAETPDKLQAVIDDEEAEGFQVVLNSTGGNLDAGLRIGRIIRENKFHTWVGRPVYSPPGFVSPFNELASGECLSACAYAFLGGVVRGVHQGGRLGFHRVALPGGGDLPGSGGLTAGQMVAAQLIAYLAEMGVDARIFVAASQTPSQEMHYPSPEDLETYDLVTPRGFGPFALEPYGDGIIAVSKRRDETRPYDHVFQLTAFCRGTETYFMLTADHPYLTPADDDLGRTRLLLGGSEIGVREITIRNDSRYTYLTVQFSSRDLSRIAAADSLEVGYFQSRAAGGDYAAALPLTARERDTLAAAFRFCI